MASFLLIGLGHFGSSVALALDKAGHEVAGIDADPIAVERLADRLPELVCGDGTDPEVLAELGAAQAQAVIVSTGSDVTASILAAVTLRDLGVREIYVKVVSDLHGRILDKVGVAETIFPERESALQLSQRLGSRTILKYLSIEPGFSAQEMALPERWIGRSLRELELPRRYGVSVIAVRNFLTGETSPIPNPDAPLLDSDALLVAGRDADLERLAALR
jgi:trk system potassium uptake protein TrkA